MNLVKLKCSGGAKRGYQSFCVSTLKVISLYCTVLLVNLALFETHKFTAYIVIVLIEETGTDVTAAVTVYYCNRTKSTDPVLSRIELVSPILIEFNNM